jgi:tRNA U38,U39,U40 pseudouridine synthase TruA
MPCTAAAQHLVGRHDFTTFRSAQCQANSPLRTLDRLDVVRNGHAVDVFALHGLSCTTRCARWWAA